MLSMDVVLKAMGMDPEIVKKQLAEFQQIMASIAGNLQILREQQAEIMRQNKLIAEKLGLEFDAPENNDQFPGSRPLS